MWPRSHMTCISSNIRDSLGAAVGSILTVQTHFVSSLKAKTQRQRLATTNSNSPTKQLNTEPDFTCGSTRHVTHVTDTQTHNDLLPFHLLRLLGTSKLCPSSPAEITTSPADLLSTSTAEWLRTSHSGAPKADKRRSVLF